MAKIVGAFGMPHNPHFPDVVAGRGIRSRRRSTATTAPVAEQLRGGRAGRDRLLHLRPLQHVLREACRSSRSASRASASGPSDYPTIARRELPIACRARARGAAPRGRERVRRRHAAGARVRPHGDRPAALPSARPRCSARAGVHRRLPAPDPLSAALLRARAGDPRGDRGGGVAASAWRSSPAAASRWRSAGRGLAPDSHVGVPDPAVDGARDRAAARPVTSSGSWREATDEQLGQAGNAGGGASRLDRDAGDDRSGGAGVASRPSRSSGTRLRLGRLIRWWGLGDERLRSQQALSAGCT